MRRLVLPVALATFFLIAIFGLIERARGQSPVSPEGQTLLQSEIQGENLREVYAPLSGNAPQAPDIGFIDSPTATCYQPDPSQDACYINWYYMSVDASPNYMVAMTATINSIGPVVRAQGFFQTSMYIPFNMQDRGIKVACGALGAGGDTSLGNAYAWTIRGRDSANLSSANYGTIYCPAYAP
jgi:hypothetical protein